MDRYRAERRLRKAEEGNGEITISTDYEKNLSQSILNVVRVKSIDFGSPFLSNGMTKGPTNAESRVNTSLGRPGSKPLDRKASTETSLVFRGHIITLLSTSLIREL